MNVADTQSWPPAVRPTPVGSEITDLPKTAAQENAAYPNANPLYSYGQNQSYQLPGEYLQQPVDQDIIKRMDNLLSNIKGETKPSQRAVQYSHSNYIPQYYSQGSYSYPTQTYVQPEIPATSYDASKAFTTTTNSYRPLSSYTVPDNTTTHMQYPNSSLGGGNEAANVPFQNYPQPQSYSQADLASQSNVQTNINTYYPTGYGPNYSSQNGLEQNVSLPGQVSFFLL